MKIIYLIKKKLFSVYKRNQIESKWNNLCFFLTNIFQLKKKIYKIIIQFFFNYFMNSIYIKITQCNKYDYYKIFTQISSSQFQTQSIDIYLCFSFHTLYNHPCQGQLENFRKTKNETTYKDQFYFLVKNQQTNLKNRYLSTLN